MIRYPDAVVDIESLRHFEMEWIVRGRPAHLVPLHCFCREGKARLRWMTDGLQPCEEAVRIAVDTEGDPYTWLLQLLTEIRRIITQSGEALLDSTRFLLRSDAIWFYPALDVCGADLTTPVVAVSRIAPLLSYLPATGYQTEGSLAELAEELAEMLIADCVEKTPDPALLTLRDAAAAGRETFEAYLEEVSMSGASRAMREQDNEDILTKSAEVGGNRIFSRTGHSPPNQILQIAVWLAGPVLVACLPVATRFILPGWMDREGWRMLSAGCLGLTALADALLLFLPASPLRLSGTGNDAAAHTRPHNGMLRVIGKFVRDVRVSGLVSACASRMGALGRMGAHTAPTEMLDPSERLGFLSEGEPGTPEETKGIRAYILTSDFVIGRDPDLADLVLPDAEVGRAHARITQYNGSFFLTDLGSVNGTRLNGRRLDKHVQQPLPDRCRLDIAGRLFHFTVD